MRFTCVPYSQGLEAAHLDAKSRRVWCNSTVARNPLPPGVPQLEELGFPFVFDGSFGIAGPKCMNPAIVNRLHDDLKTGFDDPNVREAMTRYD